MLRKILCFFLGAALIGVASGSVQAETKEEKAAAFTQKVKAEIAQLGTGTEVRVELKLRDQTKLKGWISEIGETGFVVIEATSGKAVPVVYPEVTQIRGHHGHYRTRYLIATAVALLVTVLVVVLSERD